ncbi:MAG: hypothetical protein LUE86_02005, partial [Clostridiales bacterium]|nr:hypothetical protein [Clostridiales bacterium]
MKIRKTGMILAAVLLLCQSGCSRKQEDCVAQTQERGTLTVDLVYSDSPYTSLEGDVPVGLE